MHEMQLPRNSSPLLWPGNTNPLDITLKIRSVTRKRNIIDTLFGFGICDSYDHLLQLTANIAIGVSQCFTIVGIVCPPKVRNGLFTTGAVDNIDYALVLQQQRIYFTALAFDLATSFTSVARLEGGVVVINQTTHTNRPVASLPLKYTHQLPWKARSSL